MYDDRFGGEQLDGSGGMQGGNGGGGGMMQGGGGMMQGGGMQGGYGGGGMQVRQLLCSFRSLPAAKALDALIFQWDPNLAS